MLARYVLLSCVCVFVCLCVRSSHAGIVQTNCPGRMEMVKVLYFVTGIVFLRVSLSESMWVS